MNFEHKLYLRLKLEHKEDFLHLQLQNRGFKLTKKTGEGLEQFRNYFYEMDGAPEACEVHFKLVPGKNTTQTISIHLLSGRTEEHTKQIFQIIKLLNTSLPLDLLDLELRNSFYEKLYQEGKVNAYYVGLSEEEQLEVEKKAYIPIDYDWFVKNRSASTSENVSSSGIDGERAPDING